MSLLKSLNKEQKETLVDVSTPMIVVGGAGSGKTSVLINRIAYLIKNEEVDSKNILVLSKKFRMVDELKYRLNDALKKKAEGITVSTVKELCLIILREHIEEIGFEDNFTLYDKEDTRKIIKDSLVELDINEQKYPTRMVMKYISRRKNNDPTLATDPILAKNDPNNNCERIYEYYEKVLQNNNALDLDDIVMKALKILTDFPSILKEYQKQYKYILVDCYEDITKIESNIIDLLAAKGKNLYVTGNEDEALTKIDEDSPILTFKDRYKKAIQVDLKQTYRLTKNVCELTNKVIANNTVRREKESFTKKAAGELTTVYYAYDERDEATYVANIISARVATEQSEYGDFLILYRTNAQSRIIEEQLASEKIPYKIYTGTNFYEKREIKDLISYLKVLINYQDELSIRRVINIPKRNIGNTTLGKIEKCANKNGLCLYEALKDCENYAEIAKLGYKIQRFTSIIESLRELLYECTISEVITALIEKTNYIKMFEEEETQDGRDKISNVYEFVERARRFEDAVDEPTLEAFLEQTSIVEDTDTCNGSNEVRLMSIDNAKGLEYKTVFLLGFEDGVFPSYLSIFEEKDKEIEDERRLLYIALTRATDDIHITYTKSRIKNGQVNHNKVSRFYDEFPEGLYEAKKRKTKKLKLNLELEEKITPNLHSMLKFVVPTTGASKKEVAMSFSVGDKVGHTKFGSGKIEEITHSGKDFMLKVNFDTQGEKKMVYNDKTSSFFKNLK